jgi:hypothetical protein
VFQIDHCASSSVVVNYNTTPRASLFFIFSLPAIPAASAPRPENSRLDAQQIFESERSHEKTIVFSQHPRGKKEGGFGSLSYGLWS